MGRYDKAPTPTHTQRVVTKDIANILLFSHPPKKNIKKMDLQQFQQLLEQKKREIEQAFSRTLPIKVGGL